MARPTVMIVGRLFVMFWTACCPQYQWPKEEVWAWFNTI